MYMVTFSDDLDYSEYPFPVCRGKKHLFKVLRTLRCPMSHVRIKLLTDVTDELLGEFRESTCDDKHSE